jgi:hypothetical protein
MFGFTSAEEELASGTVEMSVTCANACPCENTIDTSVA